MTVYANKLIVNYERRVEYGFAVSASLGLNYQSAIDINIAQAVITRSVKTARNGQKTQQLK